MIIMKIFIISIIIAFITIHVCSSVIVVNIVVYFYSFSILTHSSWAFSWCPFAGVLPSFEYNFNSLLLTLIMESVLRFPALVSPVLWKPCL